MAVLTTVLIIVGAAAGAGGIGFGVHGGVKMHRANKKIKDAQRRSDENNRDLENQNKSTCFIMDKLGRNEIEALSDFKVFSDLIERINERPLIKDLKFDFSIPDFTPEEIKRVSVGAGVIVGGLGGAALGTAGGFAASGATTAAVMALGTASTGALISSLHGVAATNATLAAIGGGSLAAGGGGMALGTAVLGAASLGVGLLIGGIIFELTCSNIEGKADKVEKEMLQNEETIKTILSYLKSLSHAAENFNNTLSKMRALYAKYIEKMRGIIDGKALSINGKVSWHNLSHEEKTIIENTILIVGLIYNMCKVKFVKELSEKGLNEVNTVEINQAEFEAKSALSKL